MASLLECKNLGLDDNFQPKILENYIALLAVMRIAECLNMVKQVPCEPGKHDPSTVSAIHQGGLNVLHLHRLTSSQVQGDAHCTTR